MKENDLVSFELADNGLLCVFLIARDAEGINMVILAIKHFANISWLLELCG